MSKERPSSDSDEREQGPERYDRHIARLKERFPRIRENSEYFMYDLVDRDGRNIVAHTPKWVKIPVQLDESTVVHIPVWDVIETELEHRHEYGRDDYSLADALRKAGKL